MEPKAETEQGIVSIVAEPNAMTFVTRKEWHELPEMLLGELTQHETDLVFTGTNSIFFLLRSRDPSIQIRITRPYMLVRFSIGKDGKQNVSVMDLSVAEGEQLRRTQLALWE